jgi:hypothetical protein
MMNYYQVPSRQQGMDECMLNHTVPANHTHTRNISNDNPKTSQNKKGVQSLLDGELTALSSPISNGSGGT